MLLLSSVLISLLSVDFVIVVVIIVLVIVVVIVVVIVSRKSAVVIRPMMFGFGQKVIIDYVTDVCKINSVFVVVCC